MSKLQIGWAAFLVIVYASFWVWYGGNGEPLTQAEGEAMLQEIEEAYGFKRDELEEGHFLLNMYDMLPKDDGKEFYAVNLERLKKNKAGREADRKYVSVVFPLLFERGGHPVFASNVAGLQMGRLGENIDRAAVVRYRSLRDLLDMVRDPRFLAGEPYKMASLEHTEVFIARPTITFLQVRLIVGMALLILALIGWWLLGRFRDNPIRAAADA